MTSAQRTSVPSRGLVEDALTGQVACSMKSYQWELHTVIEYPFQIQKCGSSRWGFVLITERKVQIFEREYFR